MEESLQKQRIDKWLWAARFFRTRGLAAAAVTGGKVKLDGSALKPSREVGAGDQLDIISGGQRWTVTVIGVSPSRRPAREARLLYEETEASRKRREADAALRHLAPAPAAAIKGRPTKKLGRQIRGLTQSR